MRRAWVMLVTATLLISVGCGRKSYDTRLNQTLEDMRYKKRLDDNLTEPVKGKFEELQIYLRPPKALVQAKTFTMGVPPEPGKFDLEASFVELPKLSLHALARMKKPKNAPKKKGAPTAADTAVRGDFMRDTLALLAANLGIAVEDIPVSKFKPENDKKNEFKHATLAANNKTVQIYFYKKEPYDVALIFEYPGTEQATVFPKIKLSLEAFATGRSAQFAFSGGSEEEANPASVGGGGVAF